MSRGNIAPAIAVSHLNNDSSALQPFDIRFKR
jgi:hypothetical protein